METLRQADMGMRRGVYLGCSGGVLPRNVRAAGPEAAEGGVNDAGRGRLRGVDGRGIFGISTF